MLHFSRDILCLSDAGYYISRLAPFFRPMARRTAPLTVSASEKTEGLRERETESMRERARARARARASERASEREGERLLGMILSNSSYLL